MATQALAKVAKKMPPVFDDFYKPWNEWFENGGISGLAVKVPAVNITEQKDKYLVSLAAPGLKKDNFKIDVDGNMLTISSEKKNRKKKKKQGTPAKSTATQLSAAASRFLKKSTKKKLKQSMKMEYLKF